MVQRHVPRDGQEEEFCDDCRLSAVDLRIDPENAVMRCTKGRDLDFFPPEGLPAFLTETEFLEAIAERKQRKWGWRHVVRRGKRFWHVSCPDWNRLDKR